MKFIVVWAGGPAEGQEFKSCGEARMFAQAQGLSTLLACRGDSYRRATWYKADRTWYDGPCGKPLAQPLHKHLMQQE